MDVSVAGLGMLFLMPLFAVLSLLVLVSMGIPIFFRQSRPGKGGRIFRILKIRTMRSGDGADDDRLTRVGRFLRATSLDELPELWNVLKGDMSLVGPRPLLEEYLPLYSSDQARRHSIRPGITGWAQINGRNALTWEEKFELDVWYVDHRSLRLDLKILWITVWKVITRQGINAPGEATMTRFTGSPPPA
jgi:lipopolysaccharide/colanic/teichoic acid biosynthesis glycosyltransferase